MVAVAKNKDNQERLILPGEDQKNVENNGDIEFSTELKMPDEDCFIQIFVWDAYTLQPYLGNIKEYLR